MKPTASPVTERERDADHRREVGGEQDLGKNRRERAAEERRIEMRTEGLAAEPRVERNARDDRPDIEKVLAEQAKAEHEKESRDGRARHLRAGAPVDERPGKRQQPCAHTTPADSADAEIVGEQRVAGGQDRA